MTEQPQPREKTAIALEFFARRAQPRRLNAY